MSTRAFASSDSAWLHMDRSDNPMVVNGIFEVGGRWTLGLGVSIISYAGEVVVGVMSDGSVIEHPDELVAAYEDELHALAQTILGDDALGSVG